MKRKSEELKNRESKMARIKFRWKKGRRKRKVGGMERKRNKWRWRKNKIKGKAEGRIKKKWKMNEGNKKSN